MIVSRGLAVLLSTATATAGCSLIAIKPLPRDYSPKTAPQCGTQKWPIAIDGFVFVAASAVFAAIAAGDTSRNGRDLELVGLGVAAAAGATSAIIGGNWVVDCAQAQSDWDDRDPTLR